MKNIVLVRIDDRLIHGQVVTAWIKQTGGNRIIIVDEALTKDVFMQRILRAAAPPGINVEVFAVAEAAEILKGEAEAGEKIVILVKTPFPIKELIESGVSVEKVILGGMGAKAGRKKFNKNVSASPEEVDCMKNIVQSGVKIYYQLVPSESPTDMGKILNS